MATASKTVDSLDYGIELSISVAREAGTCTDTPLLPRLTTSQALAVAREVLGELAMAAALGRYGINNDARIMPYHDAHKAVVALIASRQ